MRLTRARSAVSFTGISTRARISPCGLEPGFWSIVAAFAQDENSKRQIEMHPDERLRDFRFILGGKLFPNIKRSITWSVGIMYDGPNHHWLIRQTGVMIAVPNSGDTSLLVAPRKGFPSTKSWLGTTAGPWNARRSAMHQSRFSPMESNGSVIRRNISFSGMLDTSTTCFRRANRFPHIPARKSSDSYLLPILSDKEDKVLHLGCQLSVWQTGGEQTSAQVAPGGISRARILSTRVHFESDSTRMVGYEAYYRPNRWLFGSEYWWVFVSSKTEHDPVFNGGDVVVILLVQ